MPRLDIAKDKVLFPWCVILGSSLPASIFVAGIIQTNWGWILAGAWSIGFIIYLVVLDYKAPISRITD